MTGRVLAEIAIKSWAILWLAVGAIFMGYFSPMAFSANVDWAPEMPERIRAIRHHNRVGIVNKGPTVAGRALENLVEPGGIEPPTS